MTTNEREAVMHLHQAVLHAERAIAAFQARDHGSARSQINAAKWKLDQADNRATATPPTGLSVFDGENGEDRR